MTGSLVNEREQMKILGILYSNRKSGQPVIINEYWKANIESSAQIRITLQYLFNEKEYIWCERHRDIGNIYNGIRQTLDNVTVRAKITEKGIEYYRKERDAKWKYWSLRIGLIIIIVSFVLSLIIKK